MEPGAGRRYDRGADVEGAPALHGDSMTRMRPALLVLALVSCFFPALASAQATVQGQIIIQEATPSTSAPPPPQAQVYVQPQPAPQSVYVTPGVPQATQCPVGATMEVDRWGRQRCMVTVTRHGINGGLLGGGIGLLAGGWVASWFTGLVVTVFGAVGCAFSGSVGSSSCAWTSSTADNFWAWSWVPVLGPWVQMGYTWNNADVGIYAWLAVEGLLQAGGLTMLIFGALGEEQTVLEPAPGYALSIQPIVSPSVQGLSARLSF